MSEILYKNYATSVEDLIKEVKDGVIGLPDLQRPFVWKDSKVRDLLDSMLKGYPIGFIMLWESPDNYEARTSQIGTNERIYDSPRRLVIDGQQRLTALVSSLYGIRVMDSSFRDREIKISYNPMQKEFAVWSSAYEKSPEWVARISDLFTARQNNQLSAFRRSYIRTLNEAREKKGLEPLGDTQKDEIEDSLNSVLAILNYQLPTMEISRNAKEEDVADVFVRVNSGAYKLKENNFIQTIISVYDNETAGRMERYCRESRSPAKGTSYNTLTDLDEEDLVKMAVGVGFRRARLKYAYMLLRGKDLTTGLFTQETRNQNIKLFRAAMDRIMNLNDWHTYLNAVCEAGYVDSSLISSKNAIVYCYVLYLIAKHDYGMEPLRLNRLIGRWFFASAITGYYSNSSETTMETLFAGMEKINDADGFEELINHEISLLFTDDFFTVTLPNDLQASSTLSPAWKAYVASQIVLGAPLLFGQTPLGRYLMPGASGSKKAIDKHHVFPKKYLIDQEREKKEYNQVGNYAYIDYTANITISDRPPHEYVPEFREKLGEEAFQRSCRDHALPDGFETMTYDDFLTARRPLMANIIRKAYNRLCGTE